MKTNTQGDLMSSRLQSDRVAFSDHALTWSMVAFTS